MNNKLIYRIALSKIPSVGAVTAKFLLETFGSPAAIFQAKRKELTYVPRITDAVADAILSHRPLIEAEKELTFIEKNGIQPIYFKDDNYPSRLKHFKDSPVMLYYKGNADLNHKRIVGIVGTRKPTERGKALCESLVERLKEYNVLVVSGLAYGVDIAAHRKCLETGIETVGVLGHGLNRVYPAQHKTVAERMIGQGGLLTEYTSDKGPDREHFPMRNRIVAALSDALVVVETSRKGGSMISAEFANHYNKDVFAFPGRFNDKFSQGCNLLIKSHRAALIESADDIGYVMRWETQQSPRHIQRQLFHELSPNEKNILDILNKSEDASIDKLTYESQLNPSEMAALLLTLEFKGLVKTLPGQRYMLV